MKKSIERTFASIWNVFLYMLQWTIICSIISVIVGCLVAFFLITLEKCIGIRNEHTWIVLFLPVVGGIFSYLYNYHGKGAGGGNNLVIRAASGSDEYVPLRLVPLTMFGTIFTHLTGGSVGREGTATQMGGTIAYHISRLFKITEVEKEWIIMCGISAGFSAVFGTPLAGTLFALEVLVIGRMRVEALFPVFLSGFLANIVAESFPVHHAHYVMGPVPELSFMLIVKLIICCIFFGFLGFCFEKGVQLVKGFYTKLLKNPVLVNIVGGMVVVTLAIILHTGRYLSLSLPMLSEAFTGQAHPLDFLGKLVFTVLSLGSGFQGGEVTPLFGIGATAGSFLNQWMDLPIGFMAAIGFVGVFAAATNTPITCFVMGIELFGAQGATYLLFVTILSYMLSGHNGIYTSQGLIRPKYWIGQSILPLKQKKNCHVEEKIK